jgi:hypothetical protein
MTMRNEADDGSPRTIQTHTHPSRHAVVMLECASEAEAASHLATLPLVQEGLITFDVMALCPYDGFDRLLAPEGDTANRPA